MENDILKVLISEEELATKIRQIGKQIEKDYKDENPLIVCVLKGAVIFLSDLVREINVPLDIDFMAISSYEGTSSSGVVKIIKDLSVNIENRHLIIVEDILDTGRTLDYLIRMLDERKPKSIKICSLLIKKETNLIPVEVSYFGFHIPNEFVVGYGLDYNGYYRNLKYIGVLKEEIYKGKN